MNISEMFLRHLLSSCNHCEKLGSLKKITEKMAGGARKAPEGTWTPGGGIEIPFIYNVGGSKHCKLK